jgi:hypothetical protein
MLTPTRQAIAAILSADPTISPGRRKGMLASLASPEATKNEIPRVLSRAECGRILGVSVKRIDQLARAGHLKRVMAPGTARAIGILETSLRKLLEGGAA